MRLAIIAVMLGMTVSCTDGIHGQNSFGQKADAVQTALLHSPAIRHYISSIKSNWTYLHEAQEGDGQVFAVGEDMEDHFVPGLTALLTKDNQVFIRETQENGDEVWRKE